MKQEGMYLVMTSERGVRRSLMKSVSRDVTIPSSLLPECPSSVMHAPLTSLVACKRELPF